MADKGLLKRKIALATFATGAALAIVGLFGTMGGLMHEVFADPTSKLLTKYDYVSFNDQYKLEQIKELDQKYSKDSPEYMKELKSIMYSNYGKDAFLKQTGDETYAKWKKSEKVADAFELVSFCLCLTGLVVATPSAVIIARSSRQAKGKQKNDEAVLDGVTYEDKPLDGEYQSNNENE